MKNLNLLSKSSLRASRKVRSSHESWLNTMKLRLPNDYCWKVLGALVNDLRPYLSLTEEDAIKAAIASRSRENLTSVTQSWGLQCINPLGTNKPTFVGVKYQLASLLKKFPFPEGTDKSRANSAIKKFITAEISCRNYNTFGYKSLAESGDAYWHAIFTEARHWIQLVIGNELPDQQELTLRSRHGPGASSNTQNGNTSAYFKYAEWPYDVTTMCREHAIAAISADERWLGSLEDSYRESQGIAKTRILNWDVFWDNVLNVVPGNKIAFVPKSYETFRTIAIEPTMNLYLQLGVDGYIRKRLKRWLIDLDDQSRNQRLAREGSVPNAHNAFCTLDLSMASDSISLRLCRELLPSAWYNYLISLRSPMGELQHEVLSKTFRYEKISSMGNGYTFALESLIFAALSFAVSKVETGRYRPSRIAVYGDDVIVPRSMAGLVVEAFNRAGFTLNADKSFFEGPVRESCGADWFLGQPVRPVFMKKVPQTIPELFNDRNRIYRQCLLRFGIVPRNILRLFDGWIPKGAKCYGPLSDTDFDSYLHTPSSSNSVWRDGEFRFWRITQNTSFYRGKKVGSFGFRKLMATLAGNDAHLPIWIDGTLKWPVKSGQAFLVHRPKSMYLALKNSATDVWWSEYSEPLVLANA